jgi:hypothetical protein
MLKKYSMYLDSIDSLSKLAFSLIPEGKENNKFRNNPDCRLEHQPNWHEFGIITHTLKALEHYQKKSIALLYGWNIWEPIKVYLSENVGGVQKRDLLAISIVLHDIGKFKRKLKRKSGNWTPSYTGHEKMSEFMIMNDSRVTSFLHTFSLDEEQIIYIAKCAGLHFELGKLRKEIKNSGKYDFSFLHSDACEKMCRLIALDHPQYRLELGVFFLCDSLAKTDVNVVTDSTKSIVIETQESVLAKILARGLPLAFQEAVRQKPVNIELAKRYLEVVVENLEV